MNTRQRAQLFHEMGKLLHAGLHVDKSVDLLLEQRPAPAVRSWLEGLRDGLSARLSVADAVTKHPATHPLETGLLAAGERGGKLEDSFEHLASYYELRKKSQDKAIGALIYPLILLHLGLMVPDLTVIMQGKGLSAIVPEFMGRLIIVWVILAGLGALAWFAFHSAATSVPMDRFLNAVPLLGGVRKHWALARFSQVFHTGLLASLRISETLRLAGNATQSAILHEASRRAAVKVEAGEALTPSMKATGEFPRTFMQSVATAEESGTLDLEMGRWAAAEAELAAQAQDRAAEWLPRIFYVIVVLYVASRIIGMFKGYYSGLEQMLDS